MPEFQLLQPHLKAAVLLQHHAASDVALKSEAESIARRFALPIVHAAESGFDLYIVLWDHQLALQLAEPGSGPVSIDFTAGANAHRRQYGGGTGQALARAAGLNKLDSPTLVDATGGLARDAFVFASLGACVSLIEQSPLLCLLIEFALEKGRKDPEVAAICQRMNLFKGNAQEILPLEFTSEPPEVVYLDPMYPQRQKSAAVKKDMQLLHRLVGEDNDSAALLGVALQCATKRVVVKRPGCAPPVSEHRLTGAVSAKNTRFDIYAPFRD